MATFTGNKIKDTYQSIVKAIDNDEVGGTDKQLTDGVGNELGLHVNTSGDLRVEGDLRVDGTIKDSLNSPGTNGQLLSSTLTGTDWVDASSFSVTSLTGGTGIDADASQGDVTISLNTEDFQDLIGAMVSGNTESNITVEYDDTNGKLNFTVSDLGETYTADEVTLNLDGSNQFAVADGGIDTDQLASDAVTDDKIAADSVGASELKVTGNGTALQALLSDGDGTFSWVDVVRSIATDSIIAANVSTGAVTLSLTNNSIGADQLNVSGNGTSGQVLTSDGDGSFSWDDIAGGGGGTTNVNLEIYRDNFTADGTDYQYTLSQSISDENDIQVYFDGVYQSKDNFSVSGTTLDFGTGNEVESGVEIEVIIFGATSVTLLGGSGSTNFLPIFTTSTEVGNSSISQANNILDVDLNGAVTIPVGTTAERPGTPEVGMFRYNTTLNQYEVYDGSSFVELGNTYTAGQGIALDGSNEFTVAAGSGLTQETNGLAHDDTSSQASLTASSRTYVTGVTLDTFGHVTGLTTATETFTDTTYSATGNGLDLVGTAFSHANTSSLASTSNSGRTYIQNVTVDEFGHLTGVTTATETAGDASTYTAGNGLQLSGSNQFSVASQIYGPTIIGSSNDTFIYWNEDNSIQFYINSNYVAKMEADGDFHADGDVVAFSSSTSSDERLKDNIKTIESASDKIKQLKGVEFTWKKNGKNGGGVIAQDVEKVLPGAVKEVESLNGEQSYKAVDYNAVIGLLIETNKELLERIEKLENKG
jgi:hypothetical protein